MKINHRYVFKVLDGLAAAAICVLTMYGMSGLGVPSWIGGVFGIALGVFAARVISEPLHGVFMGWWLRRLLKLRKITDKDQHD